MSRKMTMLIAGALTAFVMVLMLGVGLTVALKSFAVARAAQPSAAVSGSVTTQPMQAPV